MLREIDHKTFANGTVYLLETEDGYQAAIAVATQAEIDAGAACGQLSMINEQKN